MKRPLTPGLLPGLVLGALFAIRLPAGAEEVPATVTIIPDKVACAAFNEASVPGLNWTSNTTKTLKLTIQAPPGTKIDESKWVTREPEGMPWESKDNTECIPAHHWDSPEFVRPATQFKVLFRGVYCEGSGGTRDWDAGVLMTDIDADADNDFAVTEENPRRRPAPPGDAEAHEEEIAEQAPVVNNRRAPGLLLGVNRGFDEADEVLRAWIQVQDRIRRQQDFEVDGIRLADPDLVEATLVQKRPPDRNGKPVKCHATLAYDRNRIRVYLVVGGAAALVAPGQSYEVDASPSIVPPTTGDRNGRVQKIGDANQLLLEGLQASPDPGADAIEVTLTPDDGSMSSRDALHYTVLDVRFIRPDNTDPKPVLGISNRVTTRDLDGTDPDNYRVEVEDATIQTGTIRRRIQLESLRPAYPGRSFEPARTLDVDLERVGTGRVFRSRHLRLVVDDPDRNSDRDQTLLVDALIDAQGGGDASVEILDQMVRGVYNHETYPAVRIRTFASVSDLDLATGTNDDNPRRIRMRVMNGSQSAPASIRLGLLKWFRRTFAQVNLAPPTPDDLTVGEMSNRQNLIAIGDAGPNPESTATGGANSRLLILCRLAGDKKPKQVEVPIQPGHTPRQVADNLVTALAAADIAGCTAATNSMRNRHRTQQQRASDVPSADVLLPITVQILQVNSSDTRIKAGLGTFSGTIPTPDLEELFVGNREARTALRNYRDGIPDNTLAVLVVPSIPQSGTANPLGFAMMPARFMREDSGEKTWRGRIPIRNAFFIEAAALSTREDRHPFAAPHEASHILLDDSHVAGDASQLMHFQAPPSNAVGAPKRIANQARSFTFKYPGAPPDPLNGLSRLASPHPVDDQEAQMRGSPFITPGF